MTRLSSAHCAAIYVVLAMSPAAVFAQQFVDQTATRFPVDPLEYSNQITVGDLDGDGDLDIVFANGGGFSIAGVNQQLRILINNGAGVFTDESALRAAGALFLARGAELGDVDNDGDLDIIVAQDFNRQPQLLINNGLGVFTNQTASRLPVMLLSSSRAQFADVDNDGDLDIYLVNGGAMNRFGTGAGVMLINNGSGVFVDETASRMPAQNLVAQPMDCIFGDIDGNLTLDLRVVSRSGQSRIFKNNGQGVFANATSPSDNNCYSYDFGDMDGDGDLDMIGANASPTSSTNELLLRNNGTGLYSTATFPPNTVDDNDSKFFDYDNDGDLDLIICAIGNAERIYNNNGLGTYTLIPGLITAINDSSLDVEVADFNGDGRIDVVTAQGESGSFQNRIYMNQGVIDTVVPKIIRTEQIPSANNPKGPYWVRAVVYDDMSSDRGFHNKGIFLNYSVNGGPSQQVLMKWVGNSMWRGSIPGQPAGSAVSYFVSARDFNNNEGIGANQQFQVLFPPCPPDVTGDQVVNVNDLLAIINSWGQAGIMHHVTVQDNEFVPPVVNVKSSDTVRWTWASGFHTITSGTNCSSDGRFNVNISSGFWQYAVPGDFDGTIPYFCVPHCASGMVGQINVAPFPQDVTHDGVVNVNDLLAVINGWGACPQ